MADSGVHSKAAVGHNNPTNLATRKISAPVHRTTTETIRLASDHPQQQGHHHPGQSLGAIPLAQAIAQGNSSMVVHNSTPQNRTKKTSSFQITSVTVGCRMSNDGGEDSNDDLDESHTEDNSMDHSRITDIEAPSLSEDSYSKDDVFFNANNAALSTAPVIPTSSQYGLAIVPSTEANNPGISANESNICNSLDIASVTDNDIINLLSNSAKQDVDLREVHSHGRNERFKVVKIESTEPFKRGRWTCMDYLDQTSVNQSSAIGQPKISDPNEVCISYGVTDTGIVVPDTNNTSTKQIVDEKSSINNVESSNGPLSSQVQQDVQKKHSVMSVNSNVSGPSTFTSVAPQYFQNSVPQSNQQQQQQNQGATLPANLQPSHSSTINQPQSMPQVSIPLMNPQLNSNAAPTQQTISHSKEETYVPVSAAKQNAATTSLLAEPMTTLQGMQNIQNIPQNSGAHQQLTQQPQVINGSPTPNIQQPQSTQAPPPSTSNPGPQVITTVVTGMQQGNIAFHQQPEQEQDSMSGIHVTNPTPGQTSDSALLESLTTIAEVTQSLEDPQAHEDNESVSGTSAVAIDNKIEQAMDLVKSHLMFAVREEVEVLKEKIAELMDRINQLEAENSILKAHATPETLAQLSQSATKLPSSINNAGSGQ